MADYCCESEAGSVTSLQCANQYQNPCPPDPCAPDPCAPDPCAPCPVEEYCCEEEEQVCEDETSQSQSQSASGSRGKGRSKKRGKGKQDEEDGCEEEDDESKAEKRRKRKEKRERRRRSLDENRNETYGQSKPQPPPPAYPARTSVTTGDKVSSRSGGKAFIQCDVIAILIGAALFITILVLSFGIYVCTTDNEWNKIVEGSKPFPNLEDESLFSGQHFMIYQRAEKLRHARSHILRDNHSLEIAHLSLFGIFLAVSTIQLILYLTRGKDDHSKIVIIYYGLYGGFLILVAFFPLMSWQEVDANHKIASEYLQDFAAEQYSKKYDPSQPPDPTGVTNGTAMDAIMVAQIMDFCRDASHTSIINRDSRTLTLYTRRYRMNEMQVLGFCTHYKYRMMVLVLGYMVAIICCVIPCAACLLIPLKLRARSVAAQGRNSMQQGRYSQGAPPRPSQLVDSDGRPLTTEQLAIIEKFKRYVLSEHKRKASV